METTTNNQTSSVAQSGALDYAAALRQYNRYGRGRSMKKFCEDAGYDYWKFCKLAREGQIEMGAKSGADRCTGFIEVNPDGTQSDDAGCGELLRKALRDAGKYIRYLLGKLKTAREGEDLTGLLPCYYGL